MLDGRLKIFNSCKALSLLIIIAIPVIIVLSILRKRNNKINRLEEKLDQLIAEQKDDHSH